MARMSDPDRDTGLVSPPHGGASAGAPTRWGLIYTVLALLLLVILGLLLMAVPRNDAGDWLWTEQMSRGGWMAWSFPVALFFWIIGVVLTVFTLLAIRFPETPRVGILRLETTRGDRLFITLLGSAFINVAWLGFELGPQPSALAVCAVYAAFVFWKV
jgi:predicted small integral membrane protein